MKLSIVIPSYDSSARLQQGLEYLSRQELPAGGALEVIVADDGSSDDTARRVERWADRVPGLRYVFRARDALSCRARARNLGASLATGEVLTFLDAGILVAPGFTRRVLERYATLPRMVLVHAIYGVFPPDEPEVWRALVELSPDTLQGLFPRLAELPDWLDPRELAFDKVEDDLDRLPGAWALGWSGTLSMPRALFEQVRGFDEAFLRWGEEDCDLVYRLAQEGASLRAERQAASLHLPHPSPEASAPPETSGEPASATSNRQLLHRKRYQLESELFLHCGNNLLFPQLLAQLEQRVLSYESPHYSPPFLEAVASAYLEEGRSLLLGVEVVWLARLLPVTHLAVQDRASLARFRAAFPDRTVLRTLCLDTPFEDGDFRTALVTDVLRLLGPLVQEAMLRELRRIARTILFLHMEDFAPLSSLLGCSCSSIDELHVVAAKAGLRLVPEARVGHQVLFRAVPFGEASGA